MPEPILGAIMRMILTALAKIHNTGRVHNAVCANNVWVFSTGQVKLSGMEHSTYVEKRRGDPTKVTKFKGPTRGMAPERLLGLESTPLSDVWSLGLLALQVATGKGAYGDSGEGSLPEFKWRVIHGPAPSLDPAEQFSSKFHDFVMFCLKKNPQYRHSVDALLTHPFVLQSDDVTRRDVRQWLNGRLPPPEA